jgi:hypothetical protein
VSTPREERIAGNEAMFRFANERMSKWGEMHADENVELYFCECADEECREKITLRKSEYEGVRADSHRFVIVPGHEVPDVETVVETHEGWAVIEKAPEVAETVEKLDPRRQG